MPNSNELVMTVNKNKVEINKPESPEAKVAQKIAKKNSQGTWGTGGSRPYPFWGLGKRGTLHRLLNLTSNLTPSFLFKVFDYRGICQCSGIPEIINLVCSDLT